MLLATFIVKVCHTCWNQINDRLMSCVSCSEQAVVKSYSISVGGSGTKVDRFVAYMVPAEELPPREADGNAPTDRRVEDFDHQ